MQAQFFFYEGFFGALLVGTFLLHLSS
ncbi:hypothetical protein GQ600_27751 [Phytophthora cactorum]|nr:hypothetical protein GQ600_27751 [Phytophthora cactorum]